MADDDNLAPLVTECPNCTTRFRVSEAQLQVAGGRVRCGACLTVFQGTDHLFLDGEPYQPATQVESMSELDAMLDELAGEDVAGAPAVAAELATRELELESAPAAAAPAEEIPEELARLEQELLEAMRGEQKPDVVEPPPLEPEPAAPARESLEPAAPEPEVLEAAAPEPAIPEPEAPKAAPPEPAIPEPEVLETAAPAEEAADGALAASIDETSIEPAEMETIELAAEAPRDDDTVSDWVSEMDDDVWTERDERAEQLIEATAGFEAGELGEPGTPAKAGVAPTGPEPSEAAPSAPSLAPAFEIEEEPTRGRHWLTYALIVIAIIGLPAQVLWYQYPEWSVDTRFRPVYEMLCGVLECELPQMTNVGLIESKDMVVRSHPDIDGALIVDVLMVNNAEFAQPFPVVELSFRSLEGQLVAGRRFKPEEYLTGEVSAQDLLPVRTPVHVSLEVQDPGETAVNYSIEFR